MAVASPTTFSSPSALLEPDVEVDQVVVAVGSLTGHHDLVRSSSSGQVCLANRTWNRRTLPTPT